MTERITYNPHIRRINGQVFAHADRPEADWTEFHRLAWDDVVVDLDRFGYLPPDVPDDAVIVDESAAATVTLTFTANDTGDLTIPAGSRVGDLDPDNAVGLEGAIAFTTDAELVVTASSSDTVTATAEHTGRPYNVDIGQLVYLDDEASFAEFASVTNAVAATGGADHQLTRAVVYRALTLIYTDLMVRAGDPFDDRRIMYERMYHDEMERRRAAGIALDTDGDETTQSDAEELIAHGYIRLRRG